MLPPDQRLLEADLQSTEYRGGVAKGLWGQVATADLPEAAAWPHVYFWMAAAKRLGAPDRYHVALDVKGYRAASPTGCFWDPLTKSTLDLSKWPKGKPNSRFSVVFRTTGFSFQGRAFYHPYDRAPMSDHPQWKAELPHLMWTSSHTIIDYLEEFQSLLMSEDYIGI